MNFQWLRLPKTYLEDVKFLKLPDNTKWHYLGMYLLAGVSQCGGLITQANQPMLDEDIAFALRTDYDSLKKSLELLMSDRVGLVSKQDDCYLIVRYMDELEPDKEAINKYWSEAQRKHRGKIKQIRRESEEDIDKIRKEKTRKEIEENRLEEIRLDKNRIDKRIQGQVNDVSMTDRNDENDTSMTDNSEQEPNENTDEEEEDLF
jgi:hypothetical protein